MPQEKPKYDMNSEQARAYRRDVWENTYVSEGTMVAFPTCFPGMTVPFPLDESHITALAGTPEGSVCGGTSGFRTHLFAAEFHRLGGIVFDLGVVDKANHCAAVCIGKGTPPAQGREQGREYGGGGQVMVAFVNGPGGGRAISCRLMPMRQDLIQEWGFRRPNFDDLGECVKGEAVVHAVAPSPDVMVGVTSNHVFILHPESKKIETVGQAQAGGRVAVCSDGSVVGRDGESNLWRFDPKAASFRSKAIALPQGNWSADLTWAKDPRSSALYAVDGDGQIFSFTGEGFSGPLAKTPLTPVGPMAITIDGRMFGFCGDGIAKMFCFDLKSHEIRSLGVAVSVIQQRRYGYVFGDAVTGRDGEVIFGENDNGGHVWLYFPRLLAV
jgi:hypothetical protein